MFIASAQEVKVHRSDWVEHITEFILISFKYFFGVPFLLYSFFSFYCILSFQLLNQPGLDAVIDPGMVFDTITFYYWMRFKPTIFH
jgi:hypothetical protein